MGVTNLVKGNLYSAAVVGSNRNSYTSGTSPTNSDTARHLLSTVQIQPNYVKRLYSEVVNNNVSNGIIIHDYIVAEESEINIQESTKGDKIKKLSWLSGFFQHKKCFSEMTKSDILSYLNSLRRPVIDDPTHRSIGTYNGRQIVFMKFFRWLYNPDEPDHRKRITPPCMAGVKSLPRREKSPYKPEDIWTTDDHAIFLKYCHMPRDRCWHSMVHDTSARPHELLDLHIRDINFKISPDGIQYAVIHVHGKTTPRTLPLIVSIQYIKQWLGGHPFANNPDSKLFVSLGSYNFGQPLTRDGLLKHYQSFYRDNFFPKLMKNPIVPIKDKEAIRRPLDKPWNLYIFRHSALTHKSQILKEATLRDHAGWSTNSKMPSVYLHYFGTESCNSLLESSGIIKKERNQALGLMTVQCPGCNEPNRVGSRFCTKCEMVLTYDAYTETLSKERQRESELNQLKEKLEAVQNEQTQKFDQIMEMIRYNPKLARLKQTALTRLVNKK